MSLYNGPPRPGARGGRDQFSWDNVKADKDREYYLGHSVKALAGRWQKGALFVCWRKCSTHHFLDLAYLNTGLKHLPCCERQSPSVEIVKYESHAVQVGMYIGTPAKSPHKIRFRTKFKPLRSAKRS
ncbi:hypothetical protein Vretifemale_16487 [Volvox reticuliferus]|uniref:Multiple myeloma tumor-associated protein 2-like N-terminal domain-containing protein n=1 Tax=Volvox reticuliferus TaxID=1737510 RepID=A0A8J4CT81_9CHLO|nr:hypothetical protein Vretifemale_16487 [Volvox reticuliferus]